MSETPSEERFAVIVNVLLHYPNVTFGSSDKKSFGSSALKIHGKIFAMINSKGKFVIKLPRLRVDKFVAIGEGERFDPGHGRLMKEWLALGSESELDWLVLAKEAMDFVASKA